MIEFGPTISGSSATFETMKHKQLTRVSESVVGKSSENDTINKMMHAKPLNFKRNISSCY